MSVPESFRADLNAVDREIQAEENRKNEREDDERTGKETTEPEVLKWIDDLLRDVGYVCMDAGLYRKDNHDIIIESIIHTDNLS